MKPVLAFSGLPGNGQQTGHSVCVAHKKAPPERGFSFGSHDLRAMLTSCLPRRRLTYRAILPGMGARLRDCRTGVVEKDGLAGVVQFARDRRAAPARPNRFAPAFNLFLRQLLTYFMSRIDDSRHPSGVISTPPIRSLRRTIMGSLIQNPRGPADSHAQATDWHPNLPGNPRGRLLLRR